MSDTGSPRQPSYQKIKSLQELLERTEGAALPQAIDAEESLLGAMLTDRIAGETAFDLIGEIVGKENEDSPFYRDSHTILYRSMYALYRREQKIDLVTVANRLREKGHLERVGGIVWLSGLSQKVVSTNNAESHAKIILEKRAARDLIIQCELMKRRLLDNEDVFDSVDDLADTVENVKGLTIREKGLEPAYLAGERMIEEATGPQSLASPGIKANVQTFDDLFGGARKSKLICLAAGTSIGKSAFALWWASAGVFCERPASVALFTLEMTADEVMSRMASIMTGIPYLDIDDRKLNSSEWAEVRKAMLEIKEKKFFIDDTPSIGPRAMRAKIRRLTRRIPLDMVIVDYIQLMDWDNPREQNRERQISTIVWQLRQMSKEFNVPIVMLAQLNRESAKEKRRPELHDLRESGAIEQHSNQVIFLHTDEPRDTLRPELTVYVAKNRNGRVDECKIVFDKPTSRFYAPDVTFPDFRTSGSKSPALFDGTGEIPF